MLGPVRRSRPARVSLTDPLQALGHGGLRSMAIVAVLYNFGFFTILAYTPFPLGLSTHQLGIVYFGWGLLVALTSVFGAQRLERRFGLVAVLGVALAGVAIDLFAGGVFIDSTAALIVVVVVSGALLGIVNTVLTEAVMAAAVVERPVASAAYSFVRFTGGAIAPFVAGKLGEHVSAAAPMYLGGVMVTLSVVALVAVAPPPRPPAMRRSKSRRPRRCLPARSSWRSTRRRPTAWSRPRSASPARGARPSTSCTCGRRA